MTFTLWDVGGNARKLWKHYYDKVNAMIFVIDSSDMARLELAKQELMRCVSDPDLENCPILIFANKQDMEGALNIQNIKEKLQVKAMPKKDIAVQECSARSGAGLWMGVAKLAEIMNLVEKGQGVDLAKIESMDEKSLGLSGSTNASSGIGEERKDN